MSKLTKLQKTQNFESSIKPKIPRLSHAERVIIEVRYCEDNWSMRKIAKALT